MMVMKAHNLTVGYGKKAVVSKVDVDGLRGHVVCLLGPNGAGKTTILRTLAGLLVPLEGHVTINDRDMKEIHKKALAKKLSIVLTKRVSGGLMKVYEVVAMGRYPHTDYFGKLTEKDMSLIVEALKTVNASALADRYFDELSDGERQKVLVARALAQEPEVIILDEPTSHLDIRHRLELMEILKRLSREKWITVVLSLHEVYIAIKTCDQVLLVKDGGVMAVGAPEEVVHEAHIKELYSIEDAGFNYLLGSIEVVNRHKATTYVIGGNGHGASIYRLLTKHGIGMMTGILYRNDIDYEVARTIGIEIHSVPPFDYVSEEAIRQAKEAIEGMGYVIDAGTPIGPYNAANLELIQYACQIGKTVISMREKKVMDTLLKEPGKNIIYCTGLTQIVGFLD